MSDSGGVRSVERAFELLELIQDSGGRTKLSDLSAATGLALPTVHRLLGTLVRLGYVRQLPDRRYALGPALVRLGDGAGRQFGAIARPVLADLVDELGETANLAVLDTDQVLYIAQVPSRHSMRMFTEVGRRVAAHSTGVGKAILAQLNDDEVGRIIARTGLPVATDRSISEPAAFFAELARIRDRGYAVDDGEQEVGVRCYAVAVRLAPAPTAVSVSGPAARVDDEFGTRAVRALQRAADRIAAELR